ncbi:lytic murein transglycosylase [Arenibaculum sp.]|jgi:lytic murein transglycosylase|uniref:lytic murein transglycosylase n=1 Tax=Arenibaculum sp. TaxID=2865862 RepID=UPI002E0E604E|nr:lytic murein transglycosylase [Arenibaculum sp.]
MAGIRHRALVATLSLIVSSGPLAGCASSRPEPAAAAPVSPAAASAPVSPTAAAVGVEAARPADFPSWLAEFREEARRAGISEATLRRTLAGLEPIPSVIASDESQPEFVRPVWAYLDSAVSDARIARGRGLLAEHAPLFAAMEERYGVPAGIVAAIWGMESNFGGNVGNLPVIPALATLAHAGRRTAYGREQLLAALRIVDGGDIEPERMIGSWAGAMGQTQFIPTTYLRYAVDADSDGRRDLWSSLPDVFFSTARYLAEAGWRPGVPWGTEVVLPPGFDLSLTDLAVVRPTAQWQALGVRAAGGALPAGTEPASLLLPAGHSGPAFLVTGNYRAILRYNNSSSYALAVGHLADRLEGGGTIRAAWPRHLQPLARDERMELQRLLTERGYDTGVPDGIIGPMTRSALRRFQADQGIPADGFPTTGVLDRLRRAGTGSGGPVPAIL